MILHHLTTLAIGSGLLLHTVSARPGTSAGAPLGEERLTAMMDTLRHDVRERLPTISDDTKLAYRHRRDAVAAAMKDVAEARKDLESLAKARELVGHARHHWLSKAAEGITQARAAVRAARTAEDRDAALRELDKWQQNKQAGLDALKSREASLAEARKNEPEFKARLEETEASLARARAELADLIGGAGLGPTLASHELDAGLAKFFVLSHATPTRLAAFAAESPQNQLLVERLLADEPLMIRMAVAEGARDGLYGPAMRILEDIRRASPRATKPPFGRLALATALEHAKPIKRRNPPAARDAPAHVDPVRRYLHYEKAFLAGELDPGFRDLSTWELRFLVNADEPDDVLEWGREMLRNYRPDLIATPDDRWRYVQLVRTEVPWTSRHYKDDRDDLQFTQNILMNGGTCGRRAVLGRFLLRAFGIPTIPRPQKGHASLARWTPDGWRICLGGAWGTGWTKTPYGPDLNFLDATRARAHPADFMQVARAQWIGLVMGERKTWGLLNANPEFWNGVALYTQRDIIRANPAGTTPETEAPPPSSSFVIPEADRRVTRDRRGVITVPASATTRPAASQGRVIFMQSLLGGTQLHYARTGPATDFEYPVHVPSPGEYRLSAKISTPSWKQGLRVCVNGGEGPFIPLPHTVGLWGETEPVTIRLAAGDNVLAFSHLAEGPEKGFTIKEFKLTPTKSAAR